MEAGASAAQLRAVVAIHLATPGVAAPTFASVPTVAVAEVALVVEAAEVAEVDTKVAIVAEAAAEADVDQGRCRALTHHNL